MIRTPHIGRWRGNRNLRITHLQGPCAQTVLPRRHYVPRAWQHSRSCCYKEYRSVQCLRYENCRCNQPQPSIRLFPSEPSFKRLPTSWTPVLLFLYATNTDLEGYSANIYGMHLCHAQIQARSTISAQLRIAPPLQRARNYLHEYRRAQYLHTCTYMREC